MFARICNFGSSSQFCSIGKASDNSVSELFSSRVLWFSLFSFVPYYISILIHVIVPVQLPDFGRWKKGVDYVRMDGSTGASARTQKMEDFNKRKR